MDPQGVVLQMQGAAQPGMTYLSNLNKINIHQHLDMLEVMTGFERNNKYRICNDQDQQFMYALEDTDCCTRQVCGPARPFTMNITDNNNQPVMSLYRPFRCQAWLGWCCYLQEMDIMSPPGMSIGGIKQLSMFQFRDTYMFQSWVSFLDDVLHNLVQSLDTAAFEELCSFKADTRVMWTPWTPKFEVHDSQQQPLFHILGECCFCCPCVDIHFKVVDAQKGNDVGEIIKHWGGCREICGGVNDFSVSFPMDLDVMKKTLLLGATFLIDFNYFERNRNQ